jgi:8-oxo-dGTP pyrophosphatase MutT (NUDIX family)
MRDSRTVGPDRSTPSTGDDVVAPRLAATVMLVRDEPFEVLMVKRNERGAFASAFVFPGGVVEEGDYSEDWLGHLNNAAFADADERALRIAACRETWEEVSILPSAEDSSIAQHKMTDGAFFDSVVRAGIRLDLTRLTLFSHWVTPTFAAKRFDTRFYICRAPANSSGQCDGIETVALEWLQPRQALASAARGDRSFLLPTLENLKVLAECETCTDAIEAARSRRVVALMPRRVIVGDSVTFTVAPLSG